MQIYVESLPNRVIERVNQVYENQKIFYISLKEKYEKIIRGTEKKEICDWWLVFIEYKVNEYLKGRGFRDNLLPEDYLNKPPEDLAAVKENSKFASSISLSLSLSFSFFLVLFFHITSNSHSSFLLSESFLTSYKTMSISLPLYRRPLLLYTKSLTS